MGGIIQQIMSLISACRAPWMGKMPAIRPGVSVGIRCSVKCGPGKGFCAYLVGVEKTEVAARGCSLAEKDVVEGRNGERELNMYNPKPTQGT